MIADDHLARLLSEGKTIVVFDAECVLCSANARFILARDKKRRLLLTSVQGSVGQQLYRGNALDPADPDSIIVVDVHGVRTNSDAVLAIYSALGWPWRTAALCRWIPRQCRDPFYRLIARNRYRWFGRRATCWLPSPADRDRVI